MVANHEGQEDKLGWLSLDGTELYLDPNSTYAALANFAKDQGQTYPMSLYTLCRRLKEAKVLLRSHKDRTTESKTLEGKRRPVLVLSAALYGPEEE